MPQALIGFLGGWSWETGRGGTNQNSVIISIYCSTERCCEHFKLSLILVVVVVALLFYVHGKHLRSCRDGQST